MLYQTEYTHGGDIYSSEVLLDFSSNINPFGPPESVLNTMREAVLRAEHYPDPFCREAVKAISEYENIPQDQILIGNGAAELIYAYCAALRPRKALEPAPTFLEYDAALENHACRIIRYVLSRENSFKLKADFPDCIEKYKPDVIFLCTPNNPTGRLIDPALLEAVLEQCRSKHIRLITDECFLDLAGGSYDMKQHLQEYPELTVLKAFTKNYALAGIRIGYCLSSDRELLRKMSREVQPWNVSVIAQAAVIAALKETEYLRKTAAMIPAEREWLKSRLEEFGFWVCPSDANFLLFQAPTGLDTALRTKKAAIRSCSNYAGLGPGWYRIAVRQHTENEQLIELIRQITIKAV